jgi:hypothetical protein
MKNKLFLITSLLIINGGLFSQVPSYIPSEGLVGWWPFNGNANDESDNNNDGVVSGAYLSVDRNGDMNSSYHFDGDDFIGLPPIETNSFTITGWFKPSSLPENSFGFNCEPRYYTILSNLNHSFTDSHVLGVEIRFDFLSNLSSILGSDSTSWSDVSIGSEHNHWTFFVVTYDETNNNFTLYKDMQFEQTSFNLTNNLNQIYLGARPLCDIDQTGPGFYMFGDIDDIGMWNRVLTEKEIDDLYRSVDTNTTTDVNDNSHPTDFGGKIECYPNPTTDVINVDLSGLNDYSGQKLRIMNLSGQIVYEENVNQSKVVIDVKSLLSSGIYVLNTVDQNGNVTSTNKFVVQ